MAESLGEHKGMVEGLPFMLRLAEPVRAHVVGAFEAVSERTALARETLLFVEGDSVTDYGYVLLSGEVAVRKKDGAETVVGAPAVLGEMKQFSLPGMRSASVVVKKDAEALLFTWESFYAALGERLDEGEMYAFRDGLKKYAWQHFFGDEI